MVFTARQVTILLRPEQSKQNNRFIMSWYDYTLNRSYASAYAATTLPSVSSSIEDDGDDGMPWDDDNWVPRNKSGRQTSPNQIRGELQRYIDANSLTKSKLMKEMGVTGPAFYKFMNVGFCKLRDFAVEHSFLLVDYFNAFSNYLFSALLHFLSPAFFVQGPMEGHEESDVLGRRPFPCQGQVREGTGEESVQGQEAKGCC